MAVKIYNVINRGIRIRENGVFTAPELIADAGVFFEEAGGYYAGANIIVGEKEYAIIIAPKELGQYSGTRQWKTSNSNSSGTGSTFNGKSNTEAMASVGINIHPAAKYCMELDINGFTDWHLPSVDELEVCYRFLKPSTQDNTTSVKSLHSAVNGTNPNSNPQGAGYNISDPSQTTVFSFQEGSNQSFDTVSYWSSTQYSDNSAWYFLMSNGNASPLSKTTSYNTRAVRWIEV